MPGDFAGHRRHARRRLVSVVILIGPLPFALELRRHTVQPRRRETVGICFPAEFAVGDGPEAKFLLQCNDIADGGVFDRPQLFFFQIAYGIVCTRS